MAASLRIQTEEEDDGRWIAEIPDPPGVMVYGQSRDEALARFGEDRMESQAS